MKLYLSRQRNSLYMLSLFKPILHKVGRTKYEDLYLKHGEPIGYRNMCPESIEIFLPELGHLQPLESIRIEVNFKLIQ